ncbi:MAG: aconitate hydratase [Clostridia bacterium]|nr:aconitate hydratase [Clostridia bacterium]
MRSGVAQKLIQSHVEEGVNIKEVPEISLKIDQTLTQDATGTMAFLEFERIGVDRVKTELSVAYVDHNTLQSGFENADDHAYLRSVARRFGVVYSKAGNGICHQLHLERFAVPGKTLLGSDSHTPTCGGLGMLAIGAGGMDVAVAMGGGRYVISNQKIIKINVTGKLRHYVSAKDVSLELLRRIGAKGGVGCIMEWGGDGIKNLSVTDRATIANMGAETGATATVFPSDEVTRAFLAAQGREGDYTPVFADEGAEYDGVIEIDMSRISPLIACPHSPDNVVPVSEIEGQSIAVSQVCIGSCTNSSLTDLLKVATLLEGRRIADGVCATVSPGSAAVLSMLCGKPLESIVGAGVRLLECTCGPCIGMGLSPRSGGVSVRTFNRNFLGRSGTADALVYLASPETAVACALTGRITDPTKLFRGEMNITLPENFAVLDGMFEYPPSAEQAKNTTIERGANIKPCPEGIEPKNGEVAYIAIKVGDNITTDHIIPAGSKILPYRSNVPKLSTFCFSGVDGEFYKRASEYGASVIVGGENYVQGSSREHAALTLLHLGVRAVIAKSFARIHEANLINSGIVPLTFKRQEDYADMCLGEALTFENLLGGIDSGTVIARGANGKKYELQCTLGARSAEILKAGGLLKLTGK